MAIIDGGSSTAGKANVDAYYQVKVGLGDAATTPASVGGVRIFSENDPGTTTGTAYLKSPETSADYRLRVGVDTQLFCETFNATAQNTSIWKHAFTTMTMTQSAGFLNINAAGTSTVASNFASLQSWQYFPLFGTVSTYVEFTGQITATPTTNEVFIAGLGVASGTATEPTDGVWWQLTSGGLIGVLRYNGTTTQTGVLYAAGSIPLNTNAKYTISINEREIEWWMDDTLLGETAMPSANGQPFMSTSLPIIMMKYNSGTIGSSPNMIVKVGDISVSLGDYGTYKPWAHQLAGAGMNYQGLNGGTMGQLSQWANAAEPTAAAATNTTAALGSGLGGLFKANAMASSATDLIISSYQNPLGGVNQTARNLYITGVSVQVANQVVAVATTGFMFAVGIAYGHTAVSLATAESASFATGTTKAPRRVGVGLISLPLAAAVGAVSTPLVMSFNSPLVVHPGQFVQLIIKPVLGTATATETLLFNVGFDHYFE
jgi:hypothetical protein